MTPGEAREVTVDDVAAMVGGRVHGDGSAVIRGVAGIAEAQQGDMAFLANPKYLPMLRECKASAVLLTEQMHARLAAQVGPAVKAAVLVENADLARIRLLEHFYPPRRVMPPGIHATAVLGSDVRLGEGVAIGPYAVLGDNCSVGDGSTICAHVVVNAGCWVGSDTLIYPHVTVYPGCKVGDRVIIHSGAVIGSDGFGFVAAHGRYHKIPQVGCVVIEDDVEIGANTTVDRGALGMTRIGRGVKLDNLVQIAHNVQVDDHSALAGQAGISGSTKIGKWVRIGGQAGVVGHIEIGDGATIGAQSGVAKSVPPGSMVSGCPARPLMAVRRVDASQSLVPELLKRVRQQDRRIEELERRLEQTTTHRRG